MKQCVVKNPHIYTEEERKNLSIKSREFNSKYWTKERRQEQSERMKRIVKENPESYSAENVCGRNKQVEYNGIKLNSTWERTVVEWLDENGIVWERNKTGFEYFWDEKNANHTYFPDFYLPNQEMYVEVKGYETNRDKCKWSVLPNLFVIKENEIKQIENKTFNLSDIAR